MSLQFIIDKPLGTRCGTCSQDCPARIIETDADGLPFIPLESEDRCFKCQHCLAVCPTAALSILGRRPQDSLPLAPEHLPDLEKMSRLVRGRRTVRLYKDEDVDRDLLERLLKTLANAPTGVNRQELTFMVIDDRQVMGRWRKAVYEALQEAIRKDAFPAQAAYLRKMVEVYTATGNDVVFRGAPHALIVTAPPDAPCPNEDVVLATAYFELLAQSAGLGTVWWGVLRFFQEVFPSLKDLIGLPRDHRYSGMLFGVPAVQFARTVQRDDGAVIRRVTL